jgi:hypothetical protein
MLERQSLWVGSNRAGLGPNAGAGSEAPRWTIREAESRKLLGLARQRSHPATVWFASWHRPLLDIYEGEDESLLFTLTRGWGQGWLVSDAEGQRVGTVRANLARDGAGQRLARFEPTSDGLLGRWRAEDGQELATVIRDGEGVAMRFAACVEGQPFVKMLLLAMLLCVVPCK